MSRFKNSLPRILLSAKDYTDFHRKGSEFLLIRVICGLKQNRDASLRFRFNFTTGGKTLNLSTFIPLKIKAFSHEISNVSCCACNNCCLQ